MTSSCRLNLAVSAVKDCRCRMHDYYCVFFDMHQGAHKCIHEITEQEAKELGILKDWQRANPIPPTFVGILGVIL